MNLLSREIFDPKKQEFMLVMTPEEYQKALEGIPVQHQTASKAFSGTWTVTFTKNSPEKHKELYGE
jgi:hypothetical protein